MDSPPLDTCLEKLKCSICNRLLSVFPIYTMKDEKDNGLLSVCGRCEVPDIENSLRCEIFENLAKIIKFPCIYRENGCMENLLPEQMKQHELICFYRYETCVFRQQNNCKWNGGFNQLLQHCEVEHEDLFLKDYQFEFDLCEDHCLTNILLYCYELFIFKHSFKQELNQLNCSLIPLGYYKHTEKYYGQINLTTTDATISKMFPEIKINGNNSKSIHIYVHSILNERDTKVIGIIKIANSIEQLNLNCDCDINYYCSRGHYVCKDKRCNSPDAVMWDTKILSHISQKCFHCAFRGNVRELAIHYHKCLYKPTDCVHKSYTYENGDVQLINDCTWKDRRMDLLQHFIENHEQDMIELNETIKFKIIIKSDKVTNKFIKYFHYYDYLFLINICVDNSKGSIDIYPVHKLHQLRDFDFEIVLGCPGDLSYETSFKSRCTNSTSYNFLRNQIVNNILNFKINVSLYNRT